MDASATATSRTEMLDRLLAPVDRATFARNHWEREPLFVSRPEPAWQAGLLCDSDVDAVIELTGARDDIDVRVVRSRGRTGEPYPFARGPRGFVHRARTAERPSMHLTPGIHAHRWLDVAHCAVDALAEREVGLRRSVPGHWSRDRVRERLVEILAALADPEIAAAAALRHESRAVRESAAAPGGGFADLERARHLSQRSVLRRRAGLLTRIENDGETVLLHFGRNHVGGPASLEPALRFVAENRVFRVGDLPDSLTDETKLVLSRRLVREGYLTSTGKETSDDD